MRKMNGIIHMLSYFAVVYQIIFVLSWFSDAIVSKDKLLFVLYYSNFFDLIHLISY